MKSLTLRDWQERVDKAQGPARYTLLKQTPERKYKIKCHKHQLIYTGRVQPLATAGRTSCPRCKQEATKATKNSSTLKKLLRTWHKSYTRRKILDVY